MLKKRITLQEAPKRMLPVFCLFPYLLYLRKRKLLKMMGNRLLKHLIHKIMVAVTAILSMQPINAEETRVSLLTCSPGEEVYELFGHTALRFKNNEKGLDIVFGYGYFSFDTPNFVWRFILGETDYMVGFVRFTDFIEEYRYRGAGVTEQTIALDSVQTEKLLETLFENCRYKNRIYRYNYFYNNCTTKIRDRIIEQLTNGDSIIYTTPETGLTLRETLSRCTAKQPWTEFGINLMLGADIDKPATRETLQFLPVNLMNDLSTAYITNSEGSRAVVSMQTELLQPTEQPEQAPNHLTPFNVALLLLLFTMITMLCEVRSRKLFWVYDILLLTQQGLAGCVLLFLALFSQHPAVANNYLLILLNPIPLLLIPLVIINAVKHKKMTIMWLQTAMSVAFIVTAPFVPQAYPAPIFIFAITILVRSQFHLHRLNICESSLY